MPSRQRWRINDTLVLVCSHPRRTFTTDAHPTPAMLWGRATLRGQRGYVEQLSPPLICTLYDAATNRYGDVVRLLIWASAKDPEAYAPAQAASQWHSSQPLRLEGRDFVYDTWDVRYRTWSRFLAADLSELPTQEDEDGFVGNATYHLLPYWLASERARLARTHRLPPATQLAAYLALPTSPDGWLTAPYRPLLAQVLRAYQAYPMSAATARRIAQALRALRPPVAHLRQTPQQVN